MSINRECVIENVCNEDETPNYGSTAESAPYSRISKEQQQCSRNEAKRRAEETVSFPSNITCAKHYNTANRSDLNQLSFVHNVVLIVIGIIATVIPEVGFQSYVFYVAGLICFIPGAYHVVFVCCAVKGRKGYDFHQLPLFT
ncbi:transmembrane protein 134-like isoform X2 [Dinothrombium tinctorium]|uniref:Transmembrane protein 134-like isoform X2 n=1 Tax=Dinothrombium tinctorium TaxID=1965070 RepID=A0A3S3SKS9_9ACAR|nr:transmembrane protein 134-like isoform X2 [Dinothrombium tinctorium]RWS15502.1 transmembrane protein 134-like isoform X2 [Dinothrombium tinctorium]